MRTYSLEGLSDFILQIFDQEMEDEIRQTWLHKNIEMEYGEYKKKTLKKMYKPKTKEISKEEEKGIIQNATRFIKPINKGGENI